MTYPVARKGDTSTHGGTIINGSSTTSVDGQPVARVGDILACPIHGNNPITTGCPIWDDEGHPVARTTSQTQCGAQIIGGSTTMSIE